jgi:hypothetical protein
MELSNVSVDLLSPNVAIQRGLARVVAPDQEPGERHVEAVYVKSAAGWKLDSVREMDPPVVAPSQYEQLKALEWMIGVWVDADEKSSIETSSRWTTNQNFIVRSFKVFLNDQINFEGTQVIGWDPSANAIRSWTFDSDGGFGVGRWSGGGARWTVSSLNITPDGGKATSTNIYDIVDENTVQFSSIGRQVDGELLPNIEPVVIIRTDAK